MLLTLALGAFAAAFAAPFLLSSDDEEEDPPVAEPEIEGNAPTANLLAFADEAETGREFSLPVAPGDFVLEAFDPEKDSCVVTVEDIDVMVETGWEDDGTPYISMGVGAAASTVTFPGLEDVPSDAVDFLVPESEGEDAVTLSLTEVLQLGKVVQASPGATTYVLDGGDEHPANIFDDTLEDLGDLMPVPPTPGDLADEATTILDDLLPVPAGAGDVIDEATEAIDDLLPLAPGDGDAVDLLPDPLTDVVPVAPNPGDEADT